MTGSSEARDPAVGDESIAHTGDARNPVAGGESMKRPPNVTVLLTGLAVLVLGVLLVLDANRAVDLHFSYMAPVLVGALGAILLASGLARRGHSRGRARD